MTWRKTGSPDYLVDDDGVTLLSDDSNTKVLLVDYTGEVIFLGDDDGSTRFVDDNLGTFLADEPLRTGNQTSTWSTQAPGVT